MTDKSEKLNSALDHTRKAMNEIDCVATILYHERKSTSDDFDSLDYIYKLLKHAEQRMNEVYI